MDCEDELDKLLHSKGFYRDIFHKVKRLLNLHCVQDLAECTQGQIVNIPNIGPDGLKDWMKTRLIEALSEARARYPHITLKPHNIYTVQLR